MLPGWVVWKKRSGFLGFLRNIFGGIKASGGEMVR